MVKILVSLLLMIGTPAFAEEVAPEPVVEAPVEAYIPPAEASEGVGGWAVVDPNTGIVHGVTVCTMDVCGPNGSWQGVMPVEYQGCPAGCVLRFQTRATADGNVVGYSGHSYEVDNEKGTVAVKNNGSVKYNQNDQSFDVTTTYQNGDNKVVENKKLIPSKTKTDPNGPETGFISSDRKLDSQSSDKVGSVEIKENLETKTITDVKVKLMDIQDKEFVYNSKESALVSLDSDVDTALESQGTNDPVVISTIKELTSRIKDFIQDIFRW